MPPRNPLREEGGQPREQVDGKDFINLKTSKKITIHGADGNTQEHKVSENKSAPDKNGTFSDDETIHLIPDAAGRLMPEDPRDIIAISDSGLFITDPDQLATCTSWLHSGNRSRTILLGQDGRATPRGAICSHCDSILTTLFLAIGILGLGVILGIWKGSGLF